jgi:hypothetical protein
MRWRSASARSRLMRSWAKTSCISPLMKFMVPSPVDDAAFATCGKERRGPDLIQIRSRQRR